MRVQQCSRNGFLGEILTRVGEVSIENACNGFTLYQNYPNPFNSNTVIQINLEKRIYVFLAIYNILGQQIRTLIDELTGAGTHKIIVNSENLSSGTYYYRLVINGLTKTHKLTILK
ncbi:MAG: T9SS type A sorting domain-containing protein [Ignavibacteriales bacterium]|nr:T9SS type A sorting domain-containing protein [Ignavibacteriales bacterium]